MTYNVAIQSMLFIFIYKVCYLSYLLLVARTCYRLIDCILVPKD